MSVRRARWLVSYEGVDVTADLVPDLTSLTYTDELRGSDALELKLKDPTGKWRGDWYPSSGHRIELRFGYDGDPLVSAGAFRVDELTLAGPPDTVTISALSAGTTRPLRTNQHRAWEGLALSEIVSQLARAEGLEVVGTVPDVTIRRVTQYGESCLRFIRRLAEQHGCTASVRGEQLVFHDLLELEAAPAAVTLDRTQLGDYSLTSGTLRTYGAVQVDWWDAAAGVKRSGRAEAGPVTGGRLAPAGDTMRRQIVARSEAEAQAHARSLLDRANRLRLTGTLSIEGEPRLVAGTVLELTGMDQLSGRYSVVKSGHKMDRSGGYRTGLEVRHV